MPAMLWGQPAGVSTPLALPSLPWTLEDAQAVVGGAEAFCCRLITGHREAEHCPGWVLGKRVVPKAPMQLQGQEKSHPQTGLQKVTFVQQK